MRKLRGFVFALSIGVSYVSLMTPASLQADDEIRVKRTDTLCPGEYGKQGCESTSCTPCAQGETCGQCDSSLCDKANCGEPL